MTCQCNDNEARADFSNFPFFKPSKVPARNRVDIDSVVMDLEVHEVYRRTRSRHEQLESNRRFSIWGDTRDEATNAIAKLSPIWTSRTRS